MQFLSLPIDSKTKVRRVSFILKKKNKPEKKKSNHDVKWSFPEEIEETDGASGDFLDQRKAQHASIACIAGQTLLLFSW